MASRTANNAVMSPSNKTWNTHVHVFDHQARPFKATRLYTPCPISIQEVVKSSDCNNFVLVQASFEDGMDGILNETQRARDMFPDREFRAEVFWDEENEKDRDLDALHEAGVRCLRLHGEFGNGDDSLQLTLEALQHLLAIASSHGWAVAAQLPIATWIQLVPKLGLIDASSERNVESSGSVIIAEHFGSPAPLPHTADQAKEFEVFLDYLSHSSRFFVKLSALHRRIKLDASIEDMVPLIARLADQAPNSLLYGSDFPHVDVETRSLEPTAHLKVDGRREFGVLQSAVSPSVLHSMLVANAERIFK
jgi:predicted TIM-barrel fold metal-dependent hydrolase